jgi:hypothetical protein
MAWYKNTVVPHRQAGPAQLAVDACDGGRNDEQGTLHTSLATPARKG